MLRLNERHTAVARMEAADTRPDEATPPPRAAAGGGGGGGGGGAGRGGTHRAADRGSVKTIVHVSDCHRMFFSEVVAALPPADILTINSHTTTGRPRHCR